MKVFVRVRQARTRQDEGERERERQRSEMKRSKAAPCGKLLAGEGANTYTVERDSERESQRQSSKEHLLGSWSRGCTRITYTIGGQRESVVCETFPNTCAREIETKRDHAILGSVDFRITVACVES